MSRTRISTPTIRRRRAQGLIEYLLLLALIAIGAIWVAQNYGKTIAKLFPSGREMRWADKKHGQFVPIG